MMTDLEKSRVADHLRQAAALRNLCLRLSKAGISGLTAVDHKNSDSSRVAESISPAEIDYNVKPVE
ncbi:MAG: hypothetical protein WCH43_07550 [Verrucomicrobiota bacterium]